ncbi:putative RNA-directed DNA polymerase [Helianthus annuus]|nr:putative RNA-directed DNA polymerase [Helianthus annuus]
MSTDIIAFTQVEKTTHNSHKFGFTLSPTNYGFWKLMIQPFLVTNGLFGYIDGSIPCPPSVIATSGKEKEAPASSTVNPNYDAWLANDAHVRMLLLSTISEAVFQHVQGLREEYNGVKQNLLAREFTAVFSELPGLLADHEFLIKKPVPDVSPAQAFTASTAAQPSPASNDTIQALQQIAGRLGFQLQPTTGLSPAPTPQPFYTNRSGPNNRGRGGRGRGGRGGNNRSQVNNNRNQGQFSWASNQNTVYGTCNRCGIGHLPSQCPNRDPSTIRSRQPSANYADFRSQSDTPAWLNDTGSNNHVAPDMSGFDSATPYFGEDNLRDKSTHTTLLTGPSDGGLYTIRFPSAQPLPRVAFSTYRALTTTWHQRLGHPHAQLFSSMLSSFHLPVSDKNFDFNCSSCLVGKSSKLHLLSSDYHSSHVLDLVFCDVWGPSGVSSFDGHNYFLLCVDHFSKYMWLFPLKRKSEVFETFKRFVTMAERQFSTKVKSVQTDWGGEFRNLSSFFASIGIIHRLSCPHTSEQNGTVERRHRHVVETGLTLMAQAHVPQRFWHFAYDTAVYLINRMPSRNNSNISPFEHLFKHKPDFSFLRVFGCLCFPYLRPYNPHKMDLRSTPCIFLGYSTSHHGYRCFDPESDRIYIARHVRFIEHVFPFSKQTSNTSPIPDPTPYVSAYPTPDLSTTTQPTPLPQSSPTLNSPPQPPDSTPPSSNQPTSTPPTPPPPPPPPSPPPPPPPPPPAYTYSRKPTRSSTTSAFDQYSTNQAAPIPPSSPTPPPPSSTTTRTRPPNLRSNPKQTKPYNASFHTSTAEPEPTTFTVANADPNWRKAMAEEYSSLMRHGTWTLVPYDPRSNVVDCKWVYRLKKDQHGCVQRYKARLVAKGFHQQHGIDYTETFSPVVKATTIRVVLSLAVQHKWPLRQLDVQTAFLYGDLKETVYLKQPPGFVDPRYPNHVCRLRKSLYGLKQAPRAWFHRLSSALLALGFKGSNTDPSLFVYCASDTVLYMLVYVDDIILTGNKPEAIDHVVRRLGSTFDIKDMGPLSYFLGISVTRKDGDLHLSQQNYIKELLARANLSHAKPVSSPCTTSAMLSLGDSDPFDDPVKYRQLVGALQYVTLTRPDITFAVNKVCQFMHSPTVNHWAAVKRILRYLLGTVDHTLLFSQSSTTVLHAYTDAAFNSLSAFSDADWAGCPDDRRSTGGYAIYLGSNLVSWSARKQKTVSRSSTESEYKALADAVAELTWLETLLRELRVPIRSSPNLWCDNLGATYLSANPIFHARTKHVEVDFHFVRERVAQGKLKVQFISTKDQLADVFTKPLPADRFLYLKSKLRVLPRP